MTLEWRKNENNIIEFVDDDLGFQNVVGYIQYSENKNYISGNIENTEISCSGVRLYSESRIDQDLAMNIVKTITEYYQDYLDEIRKNND